MSTVYLLTFALALVPILSQMVVTALIWQIIARSFRAKEGRTIPSPIWLPFLMAGVAFVFMFWHTIHAVGVLSPRYDAVDSEYKIILGVNVPLEVADNVQNLVGVVPFLLISLWTIGACFWILFSPPRVLVKATIPVWLLKLLAAVGVVFFVWNSRGSWGSAIGYARALF